ncbi:class I SAM-dependent methyltransferase [Kribbella sp. NPDC026611]|uniref:class I SAM-dependent methyltransferase n=1 Tax=Kribbella sp. NPDC026611 TaxID=3154911 RepID=UPI0034015813
MSDRLAESWDQAARGYEEYFVPRFAPWVRAAVDELTDLPDGPIVVPCCGTFPEVDLLAPRFPDRRITGIDLSAEMVRLAQQRAGDRAQAIQGDAAILDPSWSAAAVVSVFGLQQLPDPAAAIKTWYAALRPAGRLTVVYWPEHTEEAGPYTLLDQVLDLPVDASWEDALVPALENVDRDELIAFPITHPSAAAYFDAANNAGPLRATALARGDDYMAELRAKYLEQAPQGEWTHTPNARLISARKSGSG